MTKGKSLGKYRKSRIYRIINQHVTELRKLSHYRIHVIAYRTEGQIIAFCDNYRTSGNTGQMQGNFMF